MMGYTSPTLIIQMADGLMNRPGTRKKKCSRTMSSSRKMMQQKLWQQEMDNDEESDEDVEVYPGGDFFEDHAQSCRSPECETGMGELLQCAAVCYGICTRDVATGSVPVQMGEEEEEDEEELEYDDPSIARQMLPWYA